MNEILKENNSQTEKVRTAALKFAESLGRYHLSLASIQTGRAITKALLNTPYDGVGIIDAEGRVIDLNEAAARHCCRTRIDILGKSIWHYLPAALVSSRKAHLESVFISGMPARFEDDCDGVWFDNIMYPVHGQDGRVMCVIVVSHEITERHQAQQNLIISNSMLDNAQRLASIGSWVYDLSTDTMTYSDELRRILGYKPGELPQPLFTFTDAILPEDLAGYLRMFDSEHCIQPFTEYRIQSRDGSLKWVLSKLEAEYDDLGRAIRITCTVQDITARKRAEEELRRRKDMLNKAQRIAAIGSWDVEMDSLKVSWSDELYHILGYSPGEIEPSSEAFLLHVHPDDQEKFLKIKTESADTIGLQNIWTELRIITREGRIKWILSNVEVEHDRSNQIARVYGIIQDITSRKQHDEELRHSKKMLDHAQRLAHIGSWEFDTSTNAIFWSDELYRMLGYGPGEIEPSLETIFSHVHPEDMGIFSERHERAPGDSGLPLPRKSTELRVIARDGQIKWVQGYIEVECDGSGALSRICGTMQDISGRKKMEELRKVHENHTQDSTERLQADP